MLFSHSGAEVRAALIDSGNEWVAEAPLKHVCGHSALTASHQPGWFFAGLKFDAALVIAPSTLTQHQLVTGLTADPIIEYLLSNCQNLHILQNRQQLPVTFEVTSEVTAEASAGTRVSFSELPAQPMRLSQFFQKVFAETIARLASLQLLKRSSVAISYDAPEQLRAISGSNPAWLQRLRLALENSNIKPADAGATADIDISAYDGPRIDSDGRLFYEQPTLAEQQSARFVVKFIAPEVADQQICGSNHQIFVKRTPNGLVVFDAQGPRLMPDVTGQCCFARLADYLAINFGRPDRPDRELDGSRDEAQP